MKPDVEAVKNQVWRTVEAFKNAADEAGKLFCFLVDNQAEQMAALVASQQAQDMSQSINGMPDEFLDVRELEERIGIKKSTLYSWHSMGKIKGYKYGGRLRFSWPEVSQGAKEASQKRSAKFKAAKNRA